MPDLVKCWRSTARAVATSSAVRTVSPTGNGLRGLTLCHGRIVRGDVSETHQQTTALENAATHWSMGGCGTDQDKNSCDFIWMEHTCRAPCLKWTPNSIRTCRWLHRRRLGTWVCSASCNSWWSASLCAMNEGRMSTCAECMNMACTACSRLLWREDSRRSSCCSDTNLSRQKKNHLTSNVKDWIWPDTWRDDLWDKNMFT